MSKTPRVALLDRILTGIATPILAARLKPLTLQLSSRQVGAPAVIEVPTRHGNVRCFVYQPHPDAPLARGGVRPPVHLNIHGGGFLLGNPRQDEHIARYIAGEVGAVVINVDYDTVPKAVYPVAEEQCFDVYDWVSNTRLGHAWDTGRVSISGSSAGGKLAINVLQQAHSASRENIRAAALVVPYNDATLRPDEYHSPLPKPVIGQATVAMMRRWYFVDERRRTETLASPGLDPDLAAAMPPTLIISASNDTFLPQVEGLAHRLQDAGALVTYRRFEDFDHDLIASASTPEPIVREAVGLIREHLLLHLAAGAENAD